MNKEAQAALEIIRSAIAADQVEMTSHFEQMIAERGMLWVDLLTIVEEPERMEDQGPDIHGWPKWRIWGAAADGTAAAIVVAIRDDDWVRCITIHWED
jgi:hypothetical protein